MVKTTQYFIDSYTRIAISGIKPLMDIINKHTAAPHQEEAEADQPTADILQSEQINDMLNGPYASFMQDKLDAYAKLIRLKLILNIDNSDNLKGARNNQLLKENIPEKFLKKLENSKLKTIQKTLDELTTAHYQALQDFFQDACQKVMQGLRDAGIEFSVLEIAGFSEQETLTELLNRCTEMQIELPKIDKQAFNFNSYLKLKSTMSIQSALSRQHEAHGKKEIEPYMKKLKNIFSEIDKTEQELLKTQAQETVTAVKEITF
ncbi:MAG: hypothetical protein K0U12_05845 [Gammaproteobacteria bacterium]|nr:hypothetical protein [Gammaproteobacteria bacterium]